MVRKVLSVSGFDTSNQNIRALQINSYELENIHEHVMRLYKRQDRHFKVLTFQEATGIVGISYLRANERVLEPNSSSITSTEQTQTINANHMEMCRFSSKESEGYKQILGEINSVISNIRTKKGNESERRTHEVKSRFAESAN